MRRLRTRRRTTGYAKAHFAECVREAEAGRSIVLTRHGRDVAKLVPVRESHPSEGERELPSRRNEGERDLPDEVAESATPYATASPPAFLSRAARRATLRRHLLEEIWPRIPEELLGRGVSKREREEILGYGAPTNESAAERGATGSVKRGPTKRGAAGQASAKEGSAKASAAKASSAKPSSTKGGSSGDSP
jgi:prevent-host-death family protein